VRILDKLGLTAEQIAARAGKVGGSDATDIVSGDPRRVEQRRLEKLGRVEPEDLSRVLPVVMGSHTEALNLDWFERETGLTVSREGESVISATHPWRACTLDGMASDGAVVQAKHVNAFSKDEEVVQRYMAQLHHEMDVTGADAAYLTVFVGTQRWDCWRIERDPGYAAKLLELEALFWTCVEQDRVWPGAEPVEPPPMPGKLREVDMDGSNEWGAFAADWLECGDAAKRHRTASEGLKKLVEPDVGLAFGAGIEIKRDKRGSLRIGELK
jgi:predicted phage-related endonuclease